MTIHINYICLKIVQSQEIYLSRVAAEKIYSLLSDSDALVYRVAEIKELIGAISCFLLVVHSNSPPPLIFISKQEAGCFFLFKMPFLGKVRLRVKFAKKGKDMAPQD